MIRPLLHRAPRRLAALLALATLSPAAFALMGGHADADGAFAAVVAIGTAATGRCTASRIGQRALLTAAHCVTNPATGAPLYGPDRPLLLDAGCDGRALPAGVREVLPAPGWRAGMDRLLAYRADRLAAQRAASGAPDAALPASRLRAGVQFSARFPDIALVLLAEPPAGIPTLPLALETPAPGGRVTLVGCGCTGLTGAAPGSTPAGRRWGESRVLRVDSPNLYTQAAQMGAGAPSLCPGDSGGPVLEGGRIVAVHGVVWGLNARQGARSNMAAHLKSVGDWDGWTRAMEP